MSHHRKEKKCNHHEKKCKVTKLVGNWSYADIPEGYNGMFQFHKDGLFYSANLDSLPTELFPAGFYSCGLFGKWKKTADKKVYNVEYLEIIALKDVNTPGAPAIVDPMLEPIPSPAVGYETGTITITGKNTAHLSTVVHVYPAGTTKFDTEPIIAFPIDLDLVKFD